jgi:Domain of unknown function (DUF6250)
MKAFLCLSLLFGMAQALPAEQLVLGGQRLTIKLLYHEDFNGPAKHWRYDGRGRVWIEGGRLQMDATGVESTAWFSKQMQGNLLITYQAHILAPIDANNMNLIFLASAPDGGDVLKLYFSGRYSEYQRIPDYIWTITNTHTRLRSDPGFVVVSEDRKTPPEPYKTYQLAVTTWQGVIHCFIDGHLIHSYKDPHPHTKGKLAFRTWHTRLWWDNLLIYQLSSVKKLAPH